MLPEGVFQRKSAPRMLQGWRRREKRGITIALVLAAAAALDTVTSPKFSPNPRISRNFGQGKHPHQKMRREILFIITQNNLKYAPKKSQPCSVSDSEQNSHSALYKTIPSKILDLNFKGLPRPQVELDFSNSLYLMQIFNAKHFADLRRN